MGLVTETFISELPTIKKQTEKETDQSLSKSDLEKDSNILDEKDIEKTNLLDEDGIRENKKIDVSLMIIARKEVGRLGSRFFSRGIDKNGNVSNFVETEQILRISPPGNLYFPNYRDNTIIFI